MGSGEGDVGVQIPSNPCQMQSEAEQREAQEGTMTEPVDNLSRIPEIHTLQDALRSFANDGRISTHYDGCWKSHPKCAMMYAADVIDEYFHGMEP